MEKSRNGAITKNTNIIENSLQYEATAGLNELRFKNDSLEVLGIEDELLKKNSTIYYDNSMIIKDLSKNYKFIKVQTLYNRIIADTRTLPYNTLFLEKIRIYYKQHFWNNIANIYNFAPSFYYMLFKSKELLYQTYQKYYLLLCIIQYTSEYENTDVFDAFKKDSKIIIDWVQPRKDANIPYILRGPLKNSPMHLNFMEHYDNLISPNYTIENITQYLILVGIQNNYMELANFRKDMNSRENVFYKNLDKARKYTLNINTIYVKKEIGDNNVLKFDLSDIDVGDIIEQNKKAYYNTLDTIKTTNIIQSKMNIKRIEAIFNKYSTIKIIDFRISKKTYLSSLTAFDNIFLVFQGVNCDERNVDNDYVLNDGNLKFSGFFTTTENDDYFTFHPRIDMISYRQTLTNINELKLYLLTPSLNNINTILPFPVNVNINKYSLNIFNQPVYIFINYDSENITKSYESNANPQRLNIEPYLSTNIPSILDKMYDMMKDSLFGVYNINYENMIFNNYGLTLVKTVSYNNIYKDIRNESNSGWLFCVNNNIFYEFHIKDYKTIIDYAKMYKNYYFDINYWVYNKNNKINLRDITKPLTSDFNESHSYNIYAKYNQLYNTYSYDKNILIKNVFDKTTNKLFDLNIDVKINIFVDNKQTNSFNFDIFYNDNKIQQSIVSIKTNDFTSFNINNKIRNITYSELLQNSFEISLIKSINGDIDLYVTFINTQKNTVEYTQIKQILKITKDAITSIVRIETLYEDDINNHDTIQIGTEIIEAIQNQNMFDVSKIDYKKVVFSEQFGDKYNELCYKYNGNPYNKYWNDNDMYNSMRMIDITDKLKFKNIPEYKYAPVTSSLNTYENVLVLKNNNILYSNAKTFYVAYDSKTNILSYNMINDKNTYTQLFSEETINIYYNEYFTQYSLTNTTQKQYFTPVTMDLTDLSVASTLEYTLVDSSKTNFDLNASYNPLISESSKNYTATFGSNTYKFGYDATSKNLYLMIPRIDNGTTYYRKLLLKNNSFIYDSINNESWIVNYNNEIIITLFKFSQYNEESIRFKYLDNVAKFKYIKTVKFSNSPNNYVLSNDFNILDIDLVEIDYNSFIVPKIDYYYLTLTKPLYYDENNFPMLMFYSENTIASQSIIATSIESKYLGITTDSNPETILYLEKNNDNIFSIIGLPKTYEISRDAIVTKIINIEYRDNSWLLSLEWT